MPKAREELRRGVRDLIEVTSREMDALTGEVPPAPPADESLPGGEPHAAPVPPAREDRPILRLVREPGGPPAPAPASAPATPPVETQAAAPAARPVTPAAPAAAQPVVPKPLAPQPAAPQPGPARPAAPVPALAPDLMAVHAKKGVCPVYYVNHACWEVPDAYCNQALHVCMLRDCPVYNLNRDELERRFAAKFAHLW